MRIFCALIIFWGACIILYSAVEYYGDLVYIKNKTSQKKLFPDNMSLLTFLLMILFVMGYLIIDMTFLTRELTTESLITAFLFLAASIFIHILVRMDMKKSRAIFLKTGEIISTLVNVMEAKDLYMRGHSAHVYNIVRIFYGYLPRELKRQINEAKLMDAAILHDIGKVGIDAGIINKTTPLTPQEWAMITQHPNLGKEILQNTSYENVGEIIKMHHERMDGRGYFGAKPEDIPMESRMITIADAFSALYTNRAYRGKQSFEDAMRLIKASAGSQFDPLLAEVFIRIPEEVLATARYEFNE